MEPKMLHSDLLPRMPAHTDQHAVEFLQPNFSACRRVIPTAPLAWSRWSAPEGLYGMACRIEEYWLLYQAG